MSIFVLLLYSGYAVGKVAVRFRSSMIPVAAIGSRVDVRLTWALHPPADACRPKASSTWEAQPLVRLASRTSRASGMLARPKPMRIWSGWS